MGLRSVEEGRERRASSDEREALAESRRSIAGARSRLEELADRLRELGRQLDNGVRVPAAESGPPRGSYDDRGPRGRS